MKNPHFAIIGAGTAGIATAILLARENINVSIFEKASKLEPVGTGLLLQPAGLAVLEHLNILENALELGAKVNGLEGRIANQQLIVDSHYHQAHPDFYALGIHRATLCHILKTKVDEYAEYITWHMHTEVDRYVENDQGIQIFARKFEKNEDEKSIEYFFDGIIIANGARSQLRPESWIKYNQAYPWGAKWTIVPECEILDTEILHQFYDDSKIMLGILPTGSTPDVPSQKLSSIFWSLPSNQLNQFMQSPQDFSEWIELINQKWPHIATWLKQNNLDQQQHWLSANYRDVVLSKFGSGRVGILGDAAHAMSPQLGQGANMALLDAWAFSQSPKLARSQKQINWQLLWKHYHQQRQSSTNFYQFLSRLLTPLYQSDYWWASRLRDFSFQWMYKIPYFRKEMAFTISGLKTGLLTQLKYQDIAHSSNTPPVNHQIDSLKSD